MSMAKMMKELVTALVFATAAGFSWHAHALYKCVTAEGTAYQDRPCLTGTQTIIEIGISMLGDSERMVTQIVHPRVPLAPAGDLLVAVPVSFAVPIPRKE
jgi:hypothetical protein